MNANVHHFMGTVSVDVLMFRFALKWSSYLLPDSFCRVSSFIVHVNFQVVVSSEQLRSVSKSPSVFVSAVLPHSDSRGGGSSVCGGPTPHLVMNQQPPSSRTGPQGPSTKLAKVRLQQK